MYCQATEVSYNDKLNFPSSMKNLFHSVDPLYISNLIFHNFLYRPYGVLTIPPQRLINALQKHLISLQVPILLDLAQFFPFSEAFFNNTSQ